jgi:hypothetical protein
LENGANNEKGGTPAGEPFSFSNRSEVSPMVRRLSRRWL